MQGMQALKLCQEIDSAAARPGFTGDTAGVPTTWMLKMLPRALEADLVKGLASDDARQSSEAFRPQRELREQAGPGIFPDVFQATSWSRLVLGADCSRHSILLF